MSAFEVIVLVAAFCAVGSEARSPRMRGPCPNERFYAHYKVKQCTPVYQSDNDCPDKFECPEEYLTDKTVCHYNGKTYKPGEAMASPSPCLKCICSGPEDGTIIMCTSVDCFGRQKQGCYKTYSHDACCPVGEVCAGASDGSAPALTCKYKGVVYQAGQHIKVGDPCLSCICDENWDEDGEPILSSSCKRRSCILEEHLDQLKKGCLPIYHNSTCCPMYYHCESSNKEEIYAGGDRDIANRQNQCFYKNRGGLIGDTLVLKRKNDCTTCKCITPPEFTCIYKSCS